MDLEQKEQVLRKMLEERAIYSDDLFDDLLAFTDDTFKRSGEYVCPNCQAGLRLSMEIKVKRVVHSGQVYNGKGEIPVVNGSSAGQPVAHALEGSPLVTALDEALSKLPSATRPKNTPKFLEMLIERALPIKLPKYALIALMKHYGSPDVKAFGLSGMAIIVVDGEFRQFIPVSVIKGEALTGLAGNGAEITATKTQYTADTWIKTRFGYVAQRGILFDEMRSKKSVGDFAR